jgi:Fur family ferric uptake transcriptional regulator
VGAGLRLEPATEVTGRGVERWAGGIAADHGFTDVGPTVEIFGNCPDCAG